MDSSDTGPTKKSGCSMVAICQALLVVGGCGSPPKNPQPLAQYDRMKTNEHHLNYLGTGEPRSVITHAVCVYVCVCICVCVCLQDVCVWVVDG